MKTKMSLTYIVLFRTEFLDVIMLFSPAGKKAYATDCLQKRHYFILCKIL